MSKSVRLPDYLAAEVERLAAEEKRSMSNMVKVLLEQALRMDNEPLTVTRDSSVGNVRIQASVSSTPKAERKYKKRLYACEHFVPPTKVCDVCDGEAGA